MIRPVIAALIVGLLAAGAYFLYTPPKSAPESPAIPSVQEAEKTDSPRVAPPGWRVYESARYRFSLLYPEALTVREYDEGAGARTISFQDVESGVGFQLFIVPYSLDQVSEERFKRDVPSGIRENETAVTVDGVVGAAFNSRHQVLGETYEVWFIRGGLLYEVTTLKSLSSWLPTILSSFLFL